MIVLKSRLVDQESYNKICSTNLGQNPGFSIKKISGKRIYVKKRQQDLTAQYSTPFVGKIIFGQGDSIIKGMFIPTFQMTVFRVLLLGLIFYCMISDFLTYGRITWNIGEPILLVILLIAEIAGIRKKREIKCAVIHSIELAFQAELISPKVKYQEKSLKNKDQYEIWHWKLLLWTYLIMIFLFAPFFSVFAIFSIIAKAWFAFVSFMAFALWPVIDGIIHNEWLWRIQFNRKGVALKLLGREKLSFEWNEIQEIGLACTYARGPQVWIFLSKDSLINPDFRKVMKKNRRNPEVIWLPYNKKNYEILRQFYKGVIINFDSLKELTQ